MINVEQTIISQYGTSPVLRQLINNMNGYIDPTSDLDNFYDFVWNVDTAQGFGLDVWGRIVDIGRQLSIGSYDVQFGFNEAYPDFEGFGVAPFASSGDSGTAVHNLSDDAYRKVILTKALGNIASSSIPALNQIVRNLFETRGKSYILETGSMEIQYTFEFQLTPVESAIIEQSGALPHPSGVAWSVVQII